MARPRAFDDDRILTAAEELFSGQGLFETSLRQLIDRARISPTAFYARFPSREAVVEAMVDRLMTELEAMAIDVTHTAATLDEGIDLGIRGLVRILARHRVVVRLALTEGAAIPGVRRRLFGAFDQIATLVEGRLAALGKKGLSRSTDVEVLGWSLVGAMLIQIQRWVVFEAIGTKALGPALVRTARALLLPVPPP